MTYLGYFQIFLELFDNGEKAATATTWVSCLLIGGCI